MTNRRRQRRGADASEDRPTPSRRSQHNAALRDRRRRNTWLVPVAVLVVSVLLVAVLARIYVGRSADAATPPQPASQPLIGVYRLDHDRLRRSLPAQPTARPLLTDLRATLTLLSGGAASLELEQQDVTDQLTGSWQVDGERFRFEWDAAARGGAEAFAVARRLGSTLDFSAPGGGELVFARISEPSTSK